MCNIKFAWTYLYTFLCFISNVSMELMSLQRTAIGAAPGAEGSLIILFFNSKINVLSGSRSNLDPLGGLEMLVIGNSIVPKICKQLLFKNITTAMIQGYTQ